MKIIKIRDVWDTVIELEGRHYVIYSYQVLANNSDGSPEEKLELNLVRVIPNNNGKSFKRRIKNTYYKIVDTLSSAVSGMFDGIKSFYL